MSKSFYSLGLMSGTSMDGVDASIIQSDGENNYKAIKDKYFAYPKYIHVDLINIRNQIKHPKDLKKLSKKLKFLEKKITLFHFKVVKETLKSTKINIDLLGFHGQTIYHNAKKKISKQLGDGRLLSKLAKKKVIYNFRMKDLKNDGQGAPLVPIFHKMLEKKFNLKPVSFINIGGIVNITTISNNNLFASDIGPGMCLIDKWIRLKSKKKFDRGGRIARSGKIKNKILNKEVKIFYKKYIFNNKPKSFDTKDFDLSFVKDFSLKDGTATLVEYTAKIISKGLYSDLISSKKKIIILCGGGRKNKFLISRIKKKNNNIKFIDDYGLNGDFIESQAFAYLAIRSYLNKPISFPKTTGVKKPCSGGVIVKY